MTERFSGWFPVVLVAVLAALTFWIDRIVQPPQDGRTAFETGEPDYIVDGLSAARMDADGRLKHTLRAQKMTHFPDQDITLLAKPTFVTYAEGRSPVTVTSLRARVSRNGEHVYFQDDVRVVRAASTARGELVLETSYLHVIPDSNIARTDKPVTVRDGAARVTASGLELNSETRVLKLQGRVRGIFSEGSLRDAR